MSDFKYSAEYMRAVDFMREEAHDMLERFSAFTNHEHDRFTVPLIRVIYDAEITPQEAKRYSRDFKNPLVTMLNEVRIAIVSGAVWDRIQAIIRKHGFHCSFRGV